MKTRALIESVEPLTDNILKLILTPDEYTPYQAGQYLEIISGNQRYPFSIANAALGAHKLELHIRHTRDNPYTSELLADIRARGEVDIEYPLGECCFANFDKKRPFILIAGGTGFAPIKAIIEQWLADSDERHVHLFWGAKTKSDLYADELLYHWQSHVKNFQFTPILSGSPSIHEVVLNTIDELNQCQIVAQGPFDMAFSARDAFVAKGFDADYIFSDAFNYN